MRSLPAGSEPLWYLGPLEVASADVGVVPHPESVQQAIDEGTLALRSVPKYVGPRNEYPYDL